MNPHREQAETLFQAGKRDLLCVDLLIELMTSDEDWRTANELAAWSETELRSTASQGGPYDKSR